MARTRLLAALASTVMLVLTALAVSAPASPVWSTPVTVSTPHAMIISLTLTSQLGGDMIAWHYYDPLPKRQTFGPAGAAYVYAPPNSP